MNSCTCDECSSASCSPVIPPPPMMLFSSSAAGLRLLHGSSNCVDCQDSLVSFKPAARRFSVPAQPKLAFMYDAPRARAKRSLPTTSSSPMHHSTSTIYQLIHNADANNNRLGDFVFARCLILMLKWRRSYLRPWFLNPKDQIFFTLYGGITIIWYFFKKIECWPLAATSTSRWDIFSDTTKCGLANNPATA